MACSNFTYAPLPHFNNPTLIDVIEKLRQTCPDDLVDGIGIRSDIAKEIFQGVNSLFSTSLGRWSPYAGAIIVSRLIDFKLPLVQLISQLPRPRLVLGRWGEAFAILHMIVDPIDSMSSYLFTLATCQVVLRRTKEIMASIHGISPSKLAYEIKRFGRRCNHIALVYEAAHPEAFETAALSLAADRGSNFLAVGVAIFGFLMAVIVKYVYIDAETFDMTNPQHIDIWSLSSSMTMMHIIPNVLLASIISTQQSRNTASRFLQGFEERIGLRERGADWAQLEAGQQIDHGAIPNWRPNRHHASMPCGLQAIRSPWRWIIDLASFLIVMTGSAGAIGLAAAVPPEGSTAAPLSS
ncbi:hypothetical protein B0T10DRAFT_585103 [Thelonectria olida]|uniref:Uncharacterized protein n=1 Tax=Thelonectria olida TaxID=1576542 RepID=A0A9P8VWQ0_9HYPO|nr:hypothetical protein B0T10DRAFT_585103 [Thelonectria olida]